MLTGCLVATPADPGNAPAGNGLGAIGAAAAAGAEGAGEAGVSQTRNLSDELLQQRLMGFASSYMARVGDVTNRIKQTTEDPHTRRELAAFRYHAGLAAVSIATDPKPRRALLDMLVYVSLEHQVWNRQHAQAVFGEEGLMLNAALRDAKAEILGLADQIAGKQALAEVTALTLAWRRANPDLQLVSMVRFDDFDSLPVPESRRAGGGGLLNPFAPLRETNAAVDDARLLGERVVYLSKQMPLLVGWELELLLHDVVGSPTVNQTLADVHRVSDTVAGLPDTIAAEREAWWAAIDERSDRADAVLQELNQALPAAESLSGSVRDTIESLGTLVQRTQSLTQQLQDAELIGGPRAEADPEAPPFDINEYREAVEALGTTVSEMNNLLESPAWEARLAEVDAVAEQRVDQVFWQGIIWILTACVGLGVVLVIAKKVGNGNGA